MRNLKKQELKVINGGIGNFPPSPYPPMNVPGMEDMGQVMRRLQQQQQQDGQPDNRYGF